MYPTYPAVSGTVYRDATMNPQYPVRTTPAADIGGRVDGARLWTTGATGLPVHQPRSATTT